MGMEFRPYYISREFIKHGHSVDIIASDFSHLRTNNPNIKNSKIDEIDGIKYHWIHTFKYNHNGVKRIASMYQFVHKIKRSAKKIAKDINPDVIITSSTYPLDTYAGQKIKKMCKKIHNKDVMLIHEIHDMWPITPMELYGMSKFNPFIMSLQRAENSFCKKSDKVVSILPCAKEYLCEHGMRDDKFHFIPNGINILDWNEKIPLLDEYRKTLEKIKNEGKFILCFFGSHTKSYSLDYLLKALNKKDRDNLFTIFVGGGNYKDELISLAKELDLLEKNVLFFDSIQKKMIPNLLDYCDAIYVGAIKNKMFKYGIGMNKLFDSMMSGKPILYAVEAPNNYIDEFSCGISVPAENVDELSLGIDKLLSLSKDELTTMGQNGRNAVMKKFNYVSIGNEFCKLIEKDGK